MLALLKLYCYGDAFENTQFNNRAELRALLALRLWCFRRRRTHFKQKALANHSGLIDYLIMFGGIT
jgi:hypothetical protein